MVELLLVAIVSNEHIWTRNECISLANDAVTFAEIRDNGAPPSAMFQDLQQALAKRKGDPSSYVKTDEDVAIVLRVLKEVLRNPDFTPGKMYDITFEACMKASEPDLPKGIHKSGPQIQS